MELIDKIKEMCHNGTHSCKVEIILDVTGATREQLYRALVSSGLKWSVGININKEKLICIDDIIG